MYGVESRSSIFLCSSSTTVYPSYLWSRPAAIYGGGAGPVVHVAPSQARPKVALPRPVSKSRREHACVNLRITKLAVRNELCARIPILEPSVDKSGSFHSFPSQLNVIMRDTSSEGSALTTPLRRGIANRITQNEAHRQTARARRGGQGPHLSLAATCCYHRDRYPRAGHGVRCHLRP